MNHLPSALQTDLRALTVESRGRVQNLKEAAERAIMKLRSLEDKPIDVMTSSISKSEDVLKPFLMSCEAKNSKMQTIAVSSLQKLFYHKAVSMASLPLVLSKLAGLIESEEAVQLKILQAIVTLFTTTSDLHDDNLAQALVLLFRLHMNKNPNVYIPSAASLRQVITMLFDRTFAEYQESSPRMATRMSGPDTSSPVLSDTPAGSTSSTETTTQAPATAQEGEEPTSDAPATEPTPETTVPPPAEPLSPVMGMGIVVGNKAPSSLRPCGRDAYLLIQDLCLLTGGDPAAWIPMPTLSRAFGLELIELVISHYSKLFLNLEEFSFLLKDRVCPLVIKSFRFRVEFQHTLRLVRIVSAFVCNFCHILATECEVLLSRLINLLDSSDNPIWIHTIALEVCKTFCEDTQLLLSFYVYYDVESVKIFELLVETVAKYALNMAGTWEPSHITLSQNTKGRCLDQLYQTDPPPIKDAYVVSLSVECLVGIVNAIYQLATGNPADSEKSKIITPVPAQPKDVGLQMAQCSWNPLYSSLSALLTKSNDEGLIQLLLKAHQLCIHTCGLLHLSTPRDAFLTSLCKSCLPPPLALSQSNLIMSGATAVPEEATLTVPPNFSAPSTFPSPSQKNTAAIKLLLNIAPRLSIVLENGWILVLETMEHWDRILKTQLHSSADDLASPPSSPTISPASAHFSSEPSIVEALISVFKLSNTFDNESVLFMLDSLARLATAEIATLVHNAPASNHMFPITKLVDTSHANVHRVSVIWPLIMPFLIEAATHKNNTVRNYAVESLTAIIHSSLAHTSSHPLVTSQDISSATEDINRTYASQTSAEAADGTKSVDIRPYPPQSLDGHKLSTQELHVDSMQVKMLEALTELSKNNYNDVKEKTLNAVDTLLQSSGQTLNSGWPFLLTILKKVAESNDKIFIPSAFKCVQLICTDFLSNFQPHHLALFISVIGEFGKQSTDINISLTAVGLLWNVADFLAHEHTDKEKSSIYHTIDLSTLPYMKEIARHEASGNEPEGSEEVDQRPLLDRMWQCVFSVLRPLGTDRRPEVRNCALSTLFKTLTTHAHFLQLGSWPRVLQRLLFPLLDDVRNLAAAAADVKIDNELGGGVMMLVHHSRNTAQKQWDETKVLAMGGIVRVMKMFFDTLRGLPNFITFWTRVVKYLETQATSPSKEVSHAAVGNFQDIIFAHVAQATCPVDIRDVTWVALERLAVCLTSFPEISGKSVALFIQILGDMYTKTRAFIVPANMKRLIRMTLPLALYVDPAPPITSGIAVGQPSALQSSILAILQSMPPLPDSVYPLVFTQLLAFVAHAIGYQFTPTHVDSTQLPTESPTPSTSAPSTPPPTLKTENVGAYPLAERALQVISELFTRNDTSDLIRAAVYGDIANVVGAAMMTKYTRYQAGLWKAAVDTFISLLGVGLPALCKDNAIEQPGATDDQEDLKALVMTDIKRNIVWTELIDSIQAFLLHDRIPIPQPPEKRAEEEDFDVSLVDAMSTIMVKYCSASSGVHFVHERVVEILSEGVTLTNSGREKFALGCYKNMFALASANPNPRPRHPPSKSPVHSNSSTNSSRSSTPDIEPVSITPPPTSTSTSITPPPTATSADHVKLTAMIVPVLLARCREVLHRFVIDDRQSGQCPLPRYRLAEVIFLLRELLYLDLPASHTSTTNTTNTDTNSYKSTGSTTSNGTNCNNSLETTTTPTRSQHQHLIELYPLFCECITSSEKDLKDLLKEIFYLVGKEFLSVKRL